MTKCKMALRVTKKAGGKALLFREYKTFSEQKDLCMASPLFETVLELVKGDETGAQTWTNRYLGHLIETPIPECESIQRNSLLKSIYQAKIECYHEVRRNKITSQTTRDSNANGYK